MLTLECPHCQSCFTAEDWNKSLHRGEDIPENTDESEDFEKYNREIGGGMFDCPECGDVAITEDMTVV